MSEDTISGGVDFILCDLVSKTTRTSKELIEQLSKVTLEDIVRVANKIQEDTVYFLNCINISEGDTNEE